MLNTGRFDTILEDDILESAEEVEEVHQKLGKGCFSEENTIAIVMGSEGSDEGWRVGLGGEFKELEVPFCPRLVKDFKPGVCQAWQEWVKFLHNV